MRQVIGISAFGLGDTIFDSRPRLISKDFTILDVLLPEEALGSMLAGQEAEEERTHTGLLWPPEAKLEENLRRAPVPVIWRALVEAGERLATWRGHAGLDFPLGRMLAIHVDTIIKESLINEVNPQEASIPGFTENLRPVLAIPDTLDESGQESLRHELHALGLTEASLIWRPVAAALAWLEDNWADISSSTLTINSDDHIHVIYFGTDALEFTTLRLRPWEHDGQRFILPLRDRPEERMSPLTGMDWAGQIMERYSGNDQNAFWQLFTNFPEVWEALAGKFTPNTGPGQAWSTNNGWKIWSPESFDDDIASIGDGSCQILRQILQKSCPLKDYSQSSSTATMAKTIEDKIRFMAQKYSKGRLRGVVLCGSLLSREPLPAWLSQALTSLTCGQEKLLWIEPGEKVVAQGAAIYGQRNLAGEPAYLDTMPQISLLAGINGKYKWYPLLSDVAVLGGKEYTKSITDRFSLVRQTRGLDLYLLKGADQKQEISEPSECEISVAKARLLRAWIRKLGSFKKLNASDFWFNTITKDEQCYAKKYAKYYYSEERVADNSNSAVPASSPDPTSTPYRLATVAFPISPDNDIPLEVKVRMSPASGLARVSFKPQSSDFLDGREIRLNFATMTEVTDIPKPGRAWPDLLEILADPDIHQRWDDCKCKIRRLERTNQAQTKNLLSGLHEIEEIEEKCFRKCFIPSEIKKYRWMGTDFKVHGLTENGITGHSELDTSLKALACKMGRALENTRSCDKLDIISRSSWLYLAAPPQVKDEVRRLLKENDFSKKWDWNQLIAAAGKIFEEKDDLSLVFNAIVARAKKDLDGFPLPAIRSAFTMLTFRHYAPNALTVDSAWLIAEKALERLEKEGKEFNYKILFYQLILLILYLLRFRQVDDHCFSIDNVKAQKFFDKVMNIIRNSISSHKIGFSAKSNEAKEILDSFESFVQGKATVAIPTAIVDLAESED